MTLRILSLTLLIAAHLPAAVLSYSGTFGADDDLAFVNFNIDSSGTVEIRTLSAATDGFDPYLSLFEATALQLLLAVNEDEPGCGCLDSFISISSPGSYILVLSQSGNYPNGPALPDGFSQQGNGNFTGGPFLDIFGNIRTGNWEIQITGPVSAPSSEVPEPITSALLVSGLSAVALARKRRAKDARQARGYL